MEIINKADPLLVARLTKEPDIKGDLREVAEQFEAIFINQFLAQSRKIKLAEDLFGNKGTETYNSLLDQERAQQLASSVDLGAVKYFGMGSAGLRWPHGMVDWVISTSIHVGAQRWLGTSCVSGCVACSAGG